MAKRRTPLTTEEIEAALAAIAETAKALEHLAGDQTALALIAEKAKAAEEAKHD
jgi:hypothetical protein